MASVLITGCSTGIGLATALAFARGGYRTFATLRNPDKPGALGAARDEEGLAIEVLGLDVTKPETVARCVERVLGETELDILVNNAGIAGATPLELVEDAQHQAMFDANYFGPMRMIRAVLPAMRARGSGTIINVSSVAGRIAVPNQIPYSASKWALEAASEALAHEVRRFGIRVRIIEPGVIMTKIFDNAAPHTVFDKSSPYADLMRRNGKFYAAGFRVGEPAETVARVIVEAADSSSDQLRYLIGADALGWVEGRAGIADEEWVAMGEAMSDAEYAERFQRYFGIQL